jgi:hypothetical protein
MTGPILPGESVADIRATKQRRPSFARLPFESVAQFDLARMAYLQGLQDAELTDHDSDPFS